MKPTISHPSAPGVAPAFQGASQYFHAFSSALACACALDHRKDTPLDEFFELEARQQAWANSTYGEPLGQWVMATATNLLLAATVMRTTGEDEE